MPTDQTPYVPENHADLWLNVQSRLRKGRDDCLALQGQWAYRFDPNISAGEAQDAWIRYCVPREEPLSHTIDHWIRTGTIDEPAEEYRWMLLVRFETAYCFMWQFVFQRNATTNHEWICPFPYPKIESDQLLAFLLKDWWLGRGMFLFFHRSYEIASGRASYIQ